MSRAMILAAMVALLVSVMAVPALAQNNNNENRFENHLDRLEDRFGDGFFFFDEFDNGFDRFDLDRFDRFDFEGDGVSQEIEGVEQESGDVELSYEVSGEGSSSNQSTSAQQFGNTGNISNTQGVVQVGSEADDVELDGNEVSFSPELSQASDQSVEQSSAASSTTVLR